MIIMCLYPGTNRKRKPLAVPIAIMAALLVMTASCNEFLEVPPPIDKIGTDEIYKDSVNVTAAIVDIYGRMSMTMNLSIDNYITVLTGLGGDELIYNRTSDTYRQFNENRIQVDNSYVNNVWSNAYRFIYAANLILEKTADSGGLTASQKDQFVGEAKFVRALMHFYLVNLFGEVPVITSTDYRVTGIAGRERKDLVYHQITGDLKDAQARLTGNYAMQEKVRPNRSAATALLARVYLYLEQWEQAAREASKILDSNLYELESLDNAFLKSSKETIWQLFPSQAAYNTTDAYYLMPSDAESAIPQFSLADQLIDDFETNDERLTHWVGSKTVSSVKYYYAYKYKVRSGSNLDAIEYPVMFRLAEIYLIRAEARTRLGDLPGAINDLDKVRQRAGLPSLTDTKPGLTKEDMLEEVWHERKVELFGDRGGHRWFDLKRTGRANEVLAEIKGDGWSATDALWPVPGNQRAVNPYLTQNEGY